MQPNSLACRPPIYRTGRHLNTQQIDFPAPGSPAAGAETLMNSHLMSTYAPLPVGFTRGRGAWLWDESGRRILDTTSGIGVCTLGHGHEEIAQTIAEQAGMIIHTANLARIPYQERLAERICRQTGMSSAFFCSSGAESVECALKLGRLWGHHKGIECPDIIVFRGAFHGRTLGCLSASDGSKIQAGFQPLVPGFVRTEYDDLRALRQTLETHRDSACAVLLEPVQGEAGVVVPSSGFLSGVRALCNEFGLLMMADEVQSGLCKTGDWLACDHENVRPDVVSLAKALGNGIPVGACLTRGDACTLFSPGKHGSTYGGNPFVCRVADKVLEIMERDAIGPRAAELGRQLRQGLEQKLVEQEKVVAIRGRGLMIGIELDRSAVAVKSYALEKHGVLLNVTHDKVIRLLPPAVIEESSLSLVTEAVCDAIRHLDELQDTSKSA